MIYTSYFAKLKSLPENIIPISICGKAPDWYRCYLYMIVKCPVERCHEADDALGLELEFKHSNPYRQIGFRSCGKWSEMNSLSIYDYMTKRNDF